ncbi:MAG: hypothetical protein AB1454_00335 [Candidatus Auribacterota bacterium]|jgi:type IV secretory pathway VirB10-like protein|uniref:Uncharacterized protein n=1 Tax=Candidatus Auribacter fodinae TaxID=2093366 RepID=A0A3A4QR12_9BACT|nr:MAG: hypothetical protein C4541_12195 [Candidatus Auribacter fodinae]
MSKLDSLLLLFKQRLLVLFKQRKFLVISISCHIIIITAVVIMLPLWKQKKSEPIKIQEVELFTPQPQEQEKPADKKEPQTQEKAAEKEPEPEKPLVEQKVIKRPPPEPLNSNLENNILKQWDDLEKKK